MDHADAQLHEPLLDASAAEDADAAAKRHARRPAPFRRGMSTVERVALSPVEKWRAHGRFPFKIACHALLLVLTLLQMALFDAQNAAYMRATHRNWAYFFLPPSQDVGVAPRFARALYTLNQTRDAVFFVRDAYFAIANDSIANYEYARDPVHADERVRRIDMAVTTTRRPRLDSLDKNDDNDDALVTRTYRVAATPVSRVGPFALDMDAPAARRLVRSLVRVHMTMHLRDRQYGSYYDECFDWTVHVIIARDEPAAGTPGATATSAPQLRARVDDAQVQSCSTLSVWQALTRRRFVWLHAAIAGVASVYLVLSARALMRSLSLVRVVASSSATSVPLRMRLALVNRLQLVVSAALLLLLASSGWSLASLKTHVPIHFVHRLLQASALLLLWGSLVGYLEHAREIYSIVLTLRWGAPRVLQFLVGVSPIFVGFALFGTVYFGVRVKAFGSLSQSMMTLFAVLNGDVILDTFDALALHGFGVSGKLYLYAFISLFIYVVLNIFIAIVEEAFFATRHVRRLLDVMLSDPPADGAGGVAGGGGGGMGAGGDRAVDASNEMSRHLLRLLRESERTRTHSVGA